jgi:hypothetical protein
MLIKLSTWIGLENRKHEEIIVKSSIMFPLKDGKSSNIWEQIKESKF